MPRNTTDDLNNHLFEQLERLNDEDLNGEQLNEEIARSRAMSSIAHNIISNASLALNAARFKDEAMGADVQVPHMLESGD